MKVIVKPVEAVEKLAKAPEKLIAASHGCDPLRDFPCGRNTRS
ncbi:hypothetical protein [Olsenella sp. An293]|nr:hypothetical protein [Olsenella sp. An293]